MSDMEQKITAVLAEHFCKDQWTGYNHDENGPGPLRHRWACQCGVTGSNEQRPHRAHVAAVLAAVVRDAQTEAWDKGYAAAFYAIPDVTPPEYVDHTPNPYRIAIAKETE